VVALVPFALKDEPALIEKVFPAQKVSFEAQRERKAGAGQTLTALGSYWKGRKPLILVRSIVLGSLLPQTDNTEADLELFEALMAFDIKGLSRRAVAASAFSARELATNITLENPWSYFTYTVPKTTELTEEEIEEIQDWTFPLGNKADYIRVSWMRNIEDEDKASIYELALQDIPTYEERSLLCKRPEEIDQKFLYAPALSLANDHLAYLGIDANSIQELVEQLGILRFGHRPKVGDTFSGGGSIPFEAARLGCDVYASDLNPIACMLTWGALNIIGAAPKKRTEIEEAQKAVAEAVDAEITELGIEHDCHGNRAKVYLYCLETRCPETGWLVPLAPNWVISKQRNVVAKLVPDFKNKDFKIEIISGASKEEMSQAEKGTIKKNCMVYSLNGKVYQTPIKTIRGDYKDEKNSSHNKLRLWDKNDFKPRDTDIFQERLYCIQWCNNKNTFYSSVTEDDIQREKKVQLVVEKNLTEWQLDGFVSDMKIESGYENEGLIRTMGWTYWHHMFNPRQILSIALAFKSNMHTRPSFLMDAAKLLDRMARNNRWDPSREVAQSSFDNQAMTTGFNYACRSWTYCKGLITNTPPIFSLIGKTNIFNLPAQEITQCCDIFITDPPYADAVHYHEITEFFIAWLRKNPPAPFNEWVWDSRRALAIKGSGDDFRRNMIDAYSAMAKNMPDNGMQCVMFTHQDAGVWSDMVGIFWAAGLQVVAAWYIATETTSELKKGGYVQGTVTLMLRKRPEGTKEGFKQRILPAVRAEVKKQIEQMMHLNDEAKDKMGESVFNDSDLQMAGYAAALKVLTSYTVIGGENVTEFALRPRRAGEVTVVDEIVEQAAEAANSLLVPEGLDAETWQKIDGIQRFYLRMMDMETTGAAKLDNYQNFAKAFRVADYTKVMASMAANAAKLKGVSDFTSRDLTESTEIGVTKLGRLIIALQQLSKDTDPQIVVKQLQEDLPDFIESRPVLIDLIEFIANKSKQERICEVAEILASRIRNQRALGQD
jgi:adenine-specific DNA methylase